VKVSGYWFPVAASTELTNKPLGLQRFGERLVFWRSNGKVACMPDRCPHRGAALSLGRISKHSGTLACPFHGVEFAADGRCAAVPFEPDPALADSLTIASLPVCEADGYVWLWRGDASPAVPRPPVPLHSPLDGLRYGESTSIWPAHYTRCIENVCDFSHLPFVHRTTIGMFKSDRVTRIEMEEVPNGFRAHLLQRGERAQSIEFLYPNRWLLMLSPGMMLSAVFVPVDATTTCVYGRSYFRFPLPGFKWLMDAYTRLSQFLVFREDWPVVASQEPGDILGVRDEKLFPSDAPVIAYRKLHKAAALVAEI